MDENREIAEQHIYETVEEFMGILPNFSCYFLSTGWMPQVS